VLDFAFAFVPETQGAPPSVFESGDFLLGLCLTVLGLSFRTICL
jgi:hypothetical protein